MSVIDQLSRRLDDREVVVIDGGMGSELLGRGVGRNGEAFMGLLNLTHGNVVREVHEDYIHAGADVIITNTFFSTRPRLERVGLGDRVAEVNRRAVEAAIEARERVADRPIAIAGSISYSAVLDPQGRHEKLEPPARVAPDTALASYREQASALAAAGVDLIALEMMNLPSHAVPALQAAVETGLPVWLGVSAGAPTGGRVPTWSGGVMRDPIDLAELLRELVGPELAAVTLLHTEVEDTMAALDVIADCWSGTTGAYPHSGSGGGQAGWLFTDLEPEAFADEAVKWVARGVQLVGGCCGIRPDHIRAVKDRVPSHVPARQRTTTGRRMPKGTSPGRAAPSM